MKPSHGGEKVTMVFSNEEMKRKGEALGADAQLSKPEIGNLVRVVDELIMNLK